MLFKSKKSFIELHLYTNAILLATEMGRKKKMAFYAHKQAQLLFQELK